MDEEHDICCTCLSKDRFLYPSPQYAVSLAALHLEIDTSRGGICWECRSLIDRLTKFRSQVVEAQQLLRSCDQIDNLKSYSALTYSKKYYYDTHFDPITNIQITCTETGPILIKKEVTEPDDQENRNDAESSSLQKPNELPRITLVQSITEQACERNDRFQPLTEIIELNIPIPQPITVENGSKEKDSSDNMGGTTMDARETFKETLNSGKDIAVCDEEKRMEQMSKEKETIMVKVKVVTEDGNDVRIKEEPLSDDDDVQIDTNDFILTDSTANDFPENSESAETISKEEQDRRWRRSVLLVYNRLREHKYASRFVSPITDDIAPEYSNVVKRPMDLLSIKKNIQNGVVRTTAEFQRDILLMLTNALMYNDSETSIHHMAKDLLTEAQSQLGMLLAVHAQETLSDDTPSQRPRRRRDSICCIDATPPAKRPKLSTTPRNNKTNNNIPIEKPTPKRTPKIILTPIKVENIDDIEKFTSHLENTPPKRSRRISIMNVKQGSSKANKNKPLLNPKAEKVGLEKEFAKPKRVSTTPKVKSEPVVKIPSKVTARRNTVKEKHQMEKDPIVASKITSRRNTMKGKYQTQNEPEPIVATKITSRHNTSKGKPEPIVASKITSRRNTLKRKHQTQNETEPIVATKITSRRNTLKGKQQTQKESEPIVATKITSRRNTLKGKLQSQKEPEPIVATKITSRRNTLKGKQQMQKEPEPIVATKITSRRNTLKGKQQMQKEPEPIVATKITSRRNTLKGKQQTQKEPEPIVATKITSRRNTLKGKQQTQKEPEPIVATKVTSRRNTLKGKQTLKSQNEPTAAPEIAKQNEPIVPPKITSRRDTLNEHYQMLMEHNYVLTAPKEDPKPIITKNIKQELISLQNPERKSQEEIPDILDAAYMDDILTDTETHDEQLCVAITNANQRDMTTTQAQNVKRTLEEKILNIALDARYFAPRFKGKSIIVDGVIKLWCECTKTLAWLNDTVERLPRKYGKFVVKKQSEIPKKVKSALIVPGYNQVEFIMKLLKAQNSGTFIDSWIVYSAEQRGENMFIVIGIPTAAMAKLSSRGYKLAYNLGSIPIMFYEADGKLVHSPPQ